MGSIITNSLNAIHNGLNQIEQSSIGVVIGRAVSEFQKKLPSLHPVVKVSVVALASMVAVAAFVIKHRQIAKLNEAVIKGRMSLTLTSTVLFTSKHEIEELKQRVIDQEIALNLKQDELNNKTKTLQAMLETGLVTLDKKENELKEANEIIHEQKIDLNIAEVEAVDLNETIQEEKQKVANLNEQMTNLEPRSKVNFEAKNRQITAANKKIKSLQVDKNYLELKITKQGLAQTK